MKKIILITVVFISAIVALPVFATYGVQTKTSNCAANQILPDSACTPGAVLTTNVNVVCRVGYTKTVRDVSTATKKKVFAEYGIPYSQHSNYEVDHLISLEIGGGNDISNLWPENSKITDGSLTKDKFENYLHSQVCSGKMTIQEAQKEISTNWLQYYQQDKDIKTNTSSQAQPASTSTSSAPTPAPVPTTQTSTTVNNTTSSQTQPAPATNTNTNTNLVPVPIPVPTTSSSTTANNSAPAGATGKCNDGTHTYANTHRGACSHHGGVAVWY